MTEAREVADRLAQAAGPEEQDAIISELNTQRVLVMGSSLWRREAFFADTSSIGLIRDEDGRLHLITTDVHTAGAAERHGRFMSSDPNRKE